MPEKTITLTITLAQAHELVGAMTTHILGLHEWHRAYSTDNVKVRLDRVQDTRKQLVDLIRAESIPEDTIG